MDGCSMIIVISVDVGERRVVFVYCMWCVGLCFECIGWYFGDDLVVKMCSVTPPPLLDQHSKSPRSRKWPRPWPVARARRKNGRRTNPEIRY